MINKVKKNIQEKLSAARVSFELMVLSEGKGIVNVDIPEIPATRTKFLDTNDEWEKLTLPNEVNSSACIFYAKEGSSFPPHRHENSTEQMTIINVGGSCRIITNTRSFIANYPETVFFEKGEPHAVEWLTDTTTIIIWHPKFVDGGWSGDIVDNI